MRQTLVLFSFGLTQRGLAAAAAGTSADGISPTSIVLAGVGLALLAGAALLFGRDGV